VNQKLIFKNLKILLRLFSAIILKSSTKKQFFALVFLRQSLSSIFALPGFIPTHFFIKFLNLILLREFFFRHLNIYYFKKIYRDRFFLFQTASLALGHSIHVFDRSPNIDLSFLGMHLRNTTATLITNYIHIKLGQYFSIQEILRPLVFDLKNSPQLLGFRLVIAGRLTRKERAAFMIRRNGNLPLAHKNKKIDFASDFKIMRFGVVGIKVWFNIKPKIRPYFYLFKFLITK